MILDKWFEPCRPSPGSVLLPSFCLLSGVADLQPERQTGHGWSRDMFTERWDQTEPQNTAMRCSKKSLRMLKTRYRRWRSKFLTWYFTFSYYIRTYKIFYCSEARRRQKTVKYHVLRRQMTSPGAPRRKLSWDAIEQIRWGFLSQSNHSI